MHQTEAPDRLEYVVALVVPVAIDTSVVVESVGSNEDVFEPGGDMSTSVALIPCRLVSLSMSEV